MRSLKKYSCYNTTSEHRNISVKKYINFYLPICFLTLIVLISFIINIPSLYADTATQIWPCFRHDPQHTGRSPYVGPQTNNLRWHIGSAQNVATSSPAIGADGTIYIGYSNLNQNVSALYALENDPDPNQKVKVKWNYTTGGTITSTPAIGQDGTIYFGCHDKNIYALYPNGNLKWSYLTQGEVLSSPVVGTDGTIYVGSLDGHLYAINPDGTLRDSYPTATLEGIFSSPAIGKDGTIFFGSLDDSPYVIDPNGTLHKADPTGGDILSSIAIGSDGALYVASDDHNVYSIDSEGNFRIYTLGGGIVSSPAIDEDGTVYIGCRDGNVYAIDPKLQGDGIKWTYETGDEVWSSPAIGADGTIYIGSQDKYVYALTPSGDLKWSFKTGGSVPTSPAIGADGTVYIASADGRVYAFRDRVGDVWPCFRHDPLHTGRSPYVGPQTNNLRWQIGNFQNVVTSSPAIGDDGTIYIGYSDPNRYSYALYALENDPDPNHKVKIKWSFPTDGSIVSTPAIGEDGTIYFGCNDTNIYALDPNGNPKWQYPTGGMVYSSPAIGPDGTIYVGSLDGHLYAMNPDGTLRDSYPTATLEGIFSSPAIGKDGTIFFGSLDDSPYVIDPNGTLIKADPTGGDILSSFAIGSDGALYVASNDHIVYSVDSEGNFRMYTLGGGIVSSPAIDEDGTVYIGCMDGKVYALDPKDQDDGIKWTYETDAAIASSPAIGADGTIYIGSSDTYVYALTPSGDLKWSYKTEGAVSSSPAIGADGTLYIASEGGKVYAFGSGPLPCYFTAEITATGQSITGLEDNISIVSIGIAPEALVEEAPPAPPYNTVFLTLPGDVYSLTKDIRASGDTNLREEWQLNVSVGGPSSLADPNKPGYFPVLSWNPDDFCADPNAGYFRLYTEDDQGKRVPLVSDMTKVSQYQTKREDGNCAGEICAFTYYIIWSDREKFEMNFSAGWSMMSLPLVEIDNPTPEKLFPEAVVIYAYDNKLSRYVRIEDDEEMQFGTGYWILFEEDQNYVIEGHGKNSHSITVNKPGWEMIGGCTNESRPTADSCEIGVIYRYIQGSGYKRISDSEALPPGEGFWILLKEVTGQCQITVESTGALQRSRVCYVNE